jgi:hypothetical protein
MSGQDVLTQRKKLKPLQKKYLKKVLERVGN